MIGQGDQGYDKYTADIDSVRVLIPPKPIQVVRAKKRKLFDTDPHTPDLSLKKKKRCK
jgi:hypothetical protein